MDDQNSLLNNPYLEFEIPDERVRNLILTGVTADTLPSLSPDLLLELCELCRKNVIMNLELQLENERLNESQSEAIQRISAAESSSIASQNILVQAIRAGSILTEQLEHLSEIIKSLSRSQYGTSSERRNEDDKATALPPSEGDVTTATSDVEESIRFFQTIAATTKTQGEDSVEKSSDQAQSTTSSKPKRKKKGNATNPSKEAEEAEPIDVFDDGNPAEVYGEAAEKSIDEIESFLKERRKELGNGTVQPEGLDDYREEWARCTEGHFKRMYENCVHRINIIGLGGDILPEGEKPERIVELEGYTLKFVGLKEVHYEVGALETCLPVIHEMRAVYKVALDGTERPEEILKAQAALEKYGITVDGAKKAQEALAEPDSKPGTAEENPENGQTLIEESEAIGLEDSEIPDESSNPDGTVGDIGQDKAEEAEKAAKERKAEEKREAKRARERGRHRAKAAQKREAAGKPPKSEGGRKQRMETFVHSATKTVSLIDRSIWSPGLLALVLSIMFGLVVPGYRLVAGGSFLLGGVSIPASTMGAMLILVYQRKLKHLLPYLYEDLFAQGYVQADETTMRVLRMPDKSAKSKSYIWIYTSMAFSPVQIRIFDFAPGRGGKYCKAILASFAGILLTDAYQGYNLVENVTHAFCFIHFRRKIYDAYDSGGSAYIRSRAKLALDLIDMLFQIEAELQGMGLAAEVLATERERRMRPIIQHLNRLVKIMEKDKHLSKKSKLFQGIMYYKNHYTELTYFLKDGHIPMHNQASELEARVVSLHRNNSHFWGSPKGAIAFCGMLSLIETARANNLDLRKYLLFLFENMRGNDFYKNPEFVRSLLPYSERARKECASDKPRTNKPVELKGGQKTA